MTSIPEWPRAPGPRVLTLVGNDLTIDTRARKTASSLARAGFSVISIGIDWSGDKERSEDLDGAHLVRFVPPGDPRISDRIIRWSLAEWVERLRYGVEIQRQRLQMSRRSLAAWAYTEEPSRRPHPSRTAKVISGVLSRLHVSSARRAELSRSLESWIGQKGFRLRRLPRRARTILLQRRHQATRLIYRASVRVSQRSNRRLGSWRRDLPEQHKFEAALGSTIDHIEPDLVHVHDIFHLGVATRARARADAQGRPMKVVYDAHEFIPGLPSDPRRRAAYTDLEEEYIHSADAVVTVSLSLADLLRERYEVDPEIVLNAPDLDVAAEVPSVREVIGVEEDITLVLYIGGVAAHRGGDLVLDAMELLPPDVHLVLVTNTTTGYVSDLRQEAQSRGIDARVHFAPYVQPEGVVEYIRSADIGVIPLSRDVINYEVALPNKLFQSIHAGLPVAVSDNPEMARFVHSHGFGEVFDGRDARSLASAIDTILSSYSRYQEALRAADLTQFTWKTQAENLISVYARLGVAL